MVSLIYDSHIPREQAKSFRREFWDLAEMSDHISIAVGYVDTGGLADLKTYVEKTPDFTVDLFVGMQYLEGFTAAQLKVLRDLSRILKDRGRGRVMLSTKIKYHGKAYVFEKDGKPFEAYIGSGNLSALSKSAIPSYELGVLTGPDVSISTVAYLRQRVYCLGSDIDELEVKAVVKPEESPMDDFEEVSGVEAEIVRQLADADPTCSFDLELKTFSKSGLNCCKGKGCYSRISGRELPRPWYEAEIIVSKNVTCNPGYPKPGDLIDVVTDDGRQFKCKVSGDCSKNFRSAGDLGILGAFLKGRLEQYGILTPGDLVTESHLEKYGRHTVTLEFHEPFNKWFLDFSVPIESES